MAGRAGSILVQVIAPSVDIDTETLTRLAESLERHAAGALPGAIVYAIVQAPSGPR
jgi:hypothetical protein